MPFIKYDFAILGLNDVERAFSSLEKRSIEHNRRVMSGMGVPGSASGLGPGRAANTNSRLNAAEREDKAIARLQAKEDARWQSLAKKSADYRIREGLRAEKELDRQRSRAARDEEKHQERLENRSRASFANSSRGMIHGVGRTVGGALAAASAFTGIGGAALFANATHEYMATKASASGLANQMADAGESADSINKRKGDLIANALSIKGLKVTEKLEAARAFGGISGNYKLGTRLTKDLTNISLATDVGLPDVARVAGSAYMKLKTPGMSEDEAAKQTMEVVRTFVGQGNVGAVEIKDLAQYGNRLTASAAKFRGSRMENMGYMGTLAQMAVGSGSAADAAEATMAAQRFASDITEHSKEVSELKVDGKAITPFTDKGKTQFREIPNLIADIIQGTGGNMEKMKGIFGERSYKMGEAFQQTYIDAEKVQKGSGRAAIFGKFDEFKKATISEEDVNERAKARLSDEDMILTTNMENLNMAIGKELAPALSALITEVGTHKDELVSFAKAVEKTIAFLLENPFTGLGILVAGAITKELAAAGLASLIKGALLGGGPGALGGMGGISLAGVGGVAGGARDWSTAGSGMGILGALAIGTATFTVTTAILNAAKVGDSGEASKDAIATQMGLLNNSNEINARVSDPEERARQKLEAANQAGEDFEKKKAAEWAPGLFGAGEKENASARKDIEDAKHAAKMQLEAAIALKDAAALVGAAAPGAPQRTEQPSWTGYSPNGQ